MSKSYRPYLPDQDFLLPASLREWLPENHLVYVVSDVAVATRLSPESRDGPRGHGTALTIWVPARGRSWSGAASSLWPPVTLSIHQANGVSRALPSKERDYLRTASHADLVKSEQLMASQQSTAQHMEERNRL